MTSMESFGDSRAMDSGSLSREQICWNVRNWTCWTRLLGFSWVKTPRSAYMITDFYLTSNRNLLYEPIIQHSLFFVSAYQFNFFSLGVSVAGNWKQVKRLKNRTNGRSDVLEYYTLWIDPSANSFFWNNQTWLKRQIWQSEIMIWRMIRLSQLLLNSKEVGWTKMWTLDWSNQTISVSQLWSFKSERRDII